MSAQSETKQNQLGQALRESCPNLAGLVVQKNGKVAYEQYENGCTAQSPVHIFSVTKSIVSILMGIAIDHGFIEGPQQKVLDFFPGFVPPAGETALQQLTLEHLLTMTAPYRFEEEPYLDYFTSTDWVAFSLAALGGPGKPGDFHYAALVGPDLLTGILQRATGRPVLDFATQYLFAPLGIQVKETITFQSAEEQMAFNSATDRSGWVADDAGTHAGGWGLTLAPRDLAKLGQLYLASGAWQGKQLVPRQWVAESTRVHSHFGDLSYGYLWWVIDEKAGSFAAMGDGGNLLYCVPQKGLVVALTALFEPNVPERIGLIQRLVEPLF